MAEHQSNTCLVRIYITHLRGALYRYVHTRCRKRFSADQSLVDVYSSSLSVFACLPPVQYLDMISLVACTLHVRKTRGCSHGGKHAVCEIVHTPEHCHTHRRVGTCRLFTFDYNCFSRVAEFPAAGVALQQLVYSQGRKGPACSAEEFGSSALASKGKRDLGDAPSDDLCRYSFTVALAQGQGDSSSTIGPLPQLPRLAAQALGAR